MSIRNGRSLLLLVPTAATAVLLLFTGSSQAAPASNVAKPAPAGAAAVESVAAQTLTPAPATARTVAPLPAPRLTSPPNGVVYDHYPRTTTVTWRAVPGAIGYMVQAQYCESADCSVAGDLLFDRVTTPAHTFTFVGAQPGRWRAWAIDSTGAGGFASGWYGFRYTV